MTYLQQLMAQPRRSPSDTIAPEIDYSLYPSEWDEYIGQTPAKRVMEVAVKSAKIRNARMDHILISHPGGGVGKTALAAVVAKQRGTTCRVAPPTLTAAQARIMLSTMKAGDLVFIDEIHRLGGSGGRSAEWALTWLQDGTIEGPRGMEKQPDVTVIGATTDPQKLPAPLRSRFPLQPLLLDYTVEEGAEIALLTAKKMADSYGLPALALEDARILATAADCNPRGIRNLIINLLDLTLIEELAMDGERYDVKGMLAFQGITEDGLTPDAQRYLISLISDFNGKGGQRNLQDRLQIAGGLSDVENLLMKRGFLTKTGTGRQITAEGIQRFNELMKEAA